MTVRQQPLVTDRQKKAASEIMKYLKQGKPETIGKEYPGKLLEAGPTKYEGQGLDILQSMISGRGAEQYLPETFGQGKNFISDIVKGDILKPATGELYKSYTQDIEKQRQDEVDKFLQNQARFGSPYSSRTAEGLADIGEETFAQKEKARRQLAQQNINRRINAAQTAAEMGRMEQGLGQNLVSSAMQYGNLPRALENAKLQAKQQEWQRAHQEALDVPMSAGQSIWSRQPTWGVKSLSANEPSAMDRLLGAVANRAGSALGNNIGDGVGAIWDDFSGSPTDGSTGGGFTNWFNTQETGGNQSYSDWNIDQMVNQDMGWSGGGSSQTFNWR